MVNYGGNDFFFPGLKLEKARSVYFLKMDEGIDQEGLTLLLRSESLKAT